MSVNADILEEEEEEEEWVVSMARSVGRLLSRLRGGGPVPRKRIRRREPRTLESSNTQSSEE